MDEEHYNILYLEQLYFLKTVRFVSTPLSDTCLGKLQPFTR